MAYIYNNLGRAVLRVRIVLSLLGVLFFAILLAGIDGSSALKHSAGKTGINIALIVLLALFLLRIGRRVTELRRLNRATAGLLYL